MTESGADSWEAGCRGLSASDRERLRGYLARGPSRVSLAPRATQPDEAFAGWWRERLAGLGPQPEASLQRLAEDFPALWFPVSPEIGETAAYRDATEKGLFPPLSPAPRGFSPRDRLSVELAETPAGSIPVVKASSREDFTWLLNCLAGRNRPVPVPPTQGAVFLSGVMNWGRLNSYRREWQRANPFARWKEEWERIREDDASRFRDRLIVVTSGSYGGLSGEQLPPSVCREAWERGSMSIRVEHECVHYCYRRWRGEVSGTLSEEIAADFVAIRETMGLADAELLAASLGLRSSPRDQPRFTRYLPEDLLPMAETIRKIALSGCRRLCARYQGRKWSKAEAIRELEQWSLGEILG